MYLSMISADIANRAEFVTLGFQHKLEKLIHRMQRQWYGSMNHVISNYHWLYPRFRSNPRLWIPRPRACNIM
jgi:hypothetical protein